MNELYNTESSQYQRHSKDEFDKIINNETIRVGWNRSRFNNYLGTTIYFGATKKGDK